MDWYVILTPLLVLAVIALLGFAGCDLVFVINPPPGLTLRILVPSQLTVVDSRFVFTQPGSTTQETLTSLDRSDDGSGTIVLSHVVDSPAKGSWTVNAGLIVSDGTGQDISVDGPFTLDDDAPGGTATFEASGSPVTNDFRLVFDGFVPDQ